jgi:hypothetical protein
MSLEAYKLVISFFVIPFYYGSGSGILTVTGTVTVINYGSGSAKATSYGSYRCGTQSKVRTD